MPREYKASLNDILNAIRKIEKYTKKLSYQAFIEDELIQDAVIRNLEIIGEAVKNIPQTFKNRMPEMEWKKIIGLRDIVIHTYFGIDEEIIWDIIKNKLPQLKEKINEINLNISEKEISNNSK